MFYHPEIKKGNTLYNSSGFIIYVAETKSIIKGQVHNW